MQQPSLAQDLPGAESSIVFDAVEPAVHVVSLPNVGRCDHTYAYWNKEVLLGTRGGTSEDENESKVLYSNHKHDGNPFRVVANSIDPTDLIVFMKDINNPHEGNDRSILDALDVLTAQEQSSSLVATNYSSFKQSKFSKPITRGMACVASIMKPISPRKKWGHIHTFMVRRPKLWMFSIGDYVRLKRDSNQGGSFPSAYRPMGKWIQHFSEIVFSKDYFEQVVKGLTERDGGKYYERNSANATFEPDLAPICFGGIFATYWGQIASKDAPLTLEGWKAVTKDLSRGNNIEEGHFMERWWGDILTWSSWAKQTIAYRSKPNQTLLQEKLDSSRGITLPKKEQSLLMSFEKTEKVRIQNKNKIPGLVVLDYTKVEAGLP